MADDKNNPDSAMAADTKPDPAAEVKAMGKIAEALAGLNKKAVVRVVRWAADAYGVSVATTKLGGVGPHGKSGNAGTGGETANGGGSTQFADLAELYAATSPESEPDKALVAGYWTQFGEGKAEFGSQEINTALKNLGHPIGNITSAFTALKARKPAPVMQVKKAGTTKQARKTYKLTLAGKNAVEAMINQS
jgi:hypothetical protein